MHDFPWSTVGPTNWAFLRHFKRLDDAIPAKDVSTLGCAPALDIVIANPAQILLLLHAGTSRAWFNLTGRRLWLFAPGLADLEETIKVLSGLEEKGGEQKIPFDCIADVSDLVVLVGINISNAQEGLNESEMLVPVQHIHHQDQPLHIAHYLLGAAQVATRSFSHHFNHLPHLLH